jgi:hypothetical protein
MLNTLQILLGDVKEFTTLEPETPANGHEYVDLGLSVKWATMNVGATSPEEYGDYFAWGETKPKSDYNWGTYKWCDGDYNNMTKYCSHSKFGIVDNKIVLDREDDAAHVNWGGAWRMPSKAELDELIENCTWSWTTQNGVDGYTVTSKTNGNSIFLPAAGDKNGNVQHNGYGFYWSSSAATYREQVSALYFEYEGSAGIRNDVYATGQYPVRCVRMKADEEVDIDGLIWATKNIGAASNTENGSYYQSKDINKVYPSYTGYKFGCMQEDM